MRSAPEVHLPVEAGEPDMAPLQHGQHGIAALKQLPPSSPRQGIIRTIQHDKDVKIKYSEEESEQHHTEKLFEHSSKAIPKLHHQFERHQSVSIDHEASRARHEAARAKNEAERVKNEATRLKNEVEKVKNEAIRVKNEVNRTKNEEQKPSNEERVDSHTSKDQSGPRTGRDGGVSVIRRSDTFDSEGDSKHHRHQHQQHHHHHHHHHDIPGLHDGSESRRGGGRGHGHFSSHYRGGGGRGEHSRGSDHNSRLDVESQSSSTRPSHASQIGKLFDPRKDDPVRFSTLKMKYGMVPSTTTLNSQSFSNASTGTSSNFTSSDVRSLTSVDQSTVASSEGREKRRRRGPSSRTTNESAEKKRDNGRESHNSNSYVVELKRLYRDIASLELKLQDEHRSASERERREQAESSTSARYLANKPGYTAAGSLDHHYWMNLVSQHRQLAETHAAFLEAALKPGLPASLHSLPQNYNIPARLWHTAFHSLLERLRHTLPSSNLNNSDVASFIEPAASRQLQSDILDVLIEFIYFAYSYYSNLLESETYRSFRSSWIENLGDLARYRMAVAKVVAKESMSSEGSQQATTSEEASSSSESSKEEKEKQGHDSDKEKGSIGSGALQDWDLEEKEVWRATAKDWYAKGLAEMPGIGRLHHHLGILSRDDELRALHHFCKSLTSSHPYLKARESILPLFERDLQMHRIRSGAALIDLFVHLHGILFTKVQLDDFDAVFARFEVQLQAYTRMSKETGKTSGSRISLSHWMMMATVNIAALLQYSTEDREQISTVKMIIPQPQKSAVSSAKPPGVGEMDDDDDDDDDADDDAEEEGEEEIKEREEEKEKEKEKEEEDGDGEDGEEAKGASSHSPKVAASIPDEKPISLQYAARLTFTIFSALISVIISQARRSMVKVNPYVTILFTFLSQECRQSMLLDAMEPFIPWELLLQLCNRLPLSLDPINPQKDSPLRIRSDDGPLAEDWCVRGMAWVGRRVYERGFWRGPKGGGSSRGSLCPYYESEIEVLNRFATSLSAQDESLSGESETEEEMEVQRDSDATTVSVLRWKRVAFALTVLIKTVAGLDYESESGRLVLTSPLQEKVKAWDREAELEKERIRVGNLKITSGHSTLKEKLTSDDEEEDDDDDDDDDSGVDASDEDESQAVRELKQRRRYLRQQLREGKVSVSGPFKAETRESTSSSRTPSKRHPIRMTLPILAGYTILLLDTNVMLTPISVLEQLVESQKWCTIVPLVVITELEGLTRRTGVIGQRAQRAIDYITISLKSKSLYLKVQTTKGNYLNDLRFRTEEIDFSSMQPLGDAEDDKHRMARSIDEVIVHCLDWQTTHFIDRSAILIKDTEELKKTQNRISDQVYKAALITLDKNLRLKARFRGLVSLGPNDLVNLLEPASSIIESKARQTSLED